MTEPRDYTGIEAARLVYGTLSGAAFQREVGADVDKWTDAAMESAIEHEFKLTRDWLRSLLSDAMEAARADERRRPVA